jgi:hypothetical protein
MNANERSTIRAIRGPVTLITIGALFALNNFTPYRFDQTWPVILIVFGLLSLLGRSMERIPPPPPTYYPPSGYAPPPPPQGSYSQSPYAQPPTATDKGGFGTTAPPHGNEPGGTSGGNV